MVGALREGLVYDLLGRIYHSDIRAETVQHLARRFRTDTLHAERVKQTVQHMLQQISLFKASEQKKISCIYGLGC